MAIARDQGKESVIDDALQEMKQKASGELLADAAQAADVAKAETELEADTIAA
jgi:hypothetical protein